MCRKDHSECKAKTKCKCCVKMVDNEQEYGKITLTEVDNQFNQQQHVIEIKEGINYDSLQTHRT